jgi:ferritin-like protein
MAYSNNTINAKPMTLKEKIQNLGDSLLREIADDYEYFEQKGTIGDCLLRATAEQFTDTIIILMMEKVALETYRELYNRAIGIDRNSYRILQSITDT